MKILIIKLGALGDMVMATGLIHQIQRHHAHAEIWLLTSPDYTGMFSAHGGLNIYSFQRERLHDNIRALFWIRKMGFARVYDLQSNDRSAVLCALSGIPERTGNHPHFPYNIHPPEQYTGQCHIHERMITVLQSAGINMDTIAPRLLPTPEDKQTVPAWLRHHHLQDQPFVILHAGASHRHPEKCWPGFMDLAQRLTENGYAIVWAGADAEAKENRERARKVGLDASNLFSITALAELARHARFAMTNDSGPMHVLSCSGIPVYAFFGPTNWRRNHAIGQKHNVIDAGNNGAAIFTPAPLERITVDQVLDRLRQDKLIR